MIINAFITLLMYGVALVLFLLISDISPANLPLKDVLFFAHTGLMLVLVGMPWMLAFGLWENREKKLYEKRKEQF